MTKVTKTSLVIALCSLWMLCYHPSVLAAPWLSSEYYCLVDGASGQVVLSKNADQLRPVASTTKMLTAILAVEYAGLGEIAEVSEKADHTPEYTIGLRAGQKISVGELIKVALIRSSNDASVVLAEHVAGNERFFAHLMSKKAFVIGAVNTHFESASGLPSKNHYSSAYDLAQIGRYVLQNPYLSELVATRQTDFQHPGYRKPLTITNTNTLLYSYPGADGIKTGTTNAAGKCLVASATRNHRQLIAVALRSGDRGGDCARLLDYGFNETRCNKIIDKSASFKELKVNEGAVLYVHIYPEQDVYLWQGEKSPSIEKKVRMNYDLTAPIKAGTQVGVLDIYADGHLVNSIGLICCDEVKRADGPVKQLLDRLFQTPKK
ncbi:D-alanyl-D-alanine carboxypeptidase family protein [Syntrophomonas erecta]